MYVVAPVWYKLQVDTLLKQKKVGKNMRASRFRHSVMKPISVLLVIALVLGGTFVVASADDTPSFPINFPAVGETFADSTDRVWRVLYEDESGNRLIITEATIGARWYAPGLSWVPFAQSGLRAALNSETLAPEIMQSALIPNGIGQDVRSNPGDFDAEENEAIGRTSAGDRIYPQTPQQAAQALFILSVSEANHYFADNADRQAYNNVNWWLRSPGDIDVLTATAVLRSGAITTSQSFWSHGIRPALWVFGVPCCDLYPDCTCDELPCCPEYPDCTCDEPPCCPEYPDCTCDEPPCCDLYPDCDCNAPSCCPEYPDCTCDEPPCCELYPDCDCNESSCCPEYPDCTCDEQEFHRAYMFGDNYGNFNPRTSITRAEVAVILARTHIADFVPDTLPPGMTSVPFADTAAHWARFYIAWAHDANLMLGDAGSFRPGEPITRQEFAAVLARAGGAIRPAGPSSFHDVDDVASWARNYVYTVYRGALMIGDESNNFNPLEPITRAEVATAMNRMLGRIDSHEALGLADVEGLAYMRSFPDVADTAWYFPSVLAAANDHYLTRDEDGAIDWKRLVR